MNLSIIAIVTLQCSDVTIRVIRIADFTVLIARLHINICSKVRHSKLRFLQLIFLVVFVDVHALVIAVARGISGIGSPWHWTDGTVEQTLCGCERCGRWRCVHCHNNRQRCHCILGSAIGNGYHVSTCIIRGWRCLLKCLLCCILIGGIHGRPYTSNQLLPSQCAMLPHIRWSYYKRASNRNRKSCWQVDDLIVRIEITKRRRPVAVIIFNVSERDFVVGKPYINAWLVRDTAVVREVSEIIVAKLYVVQRCVSQFVGDSACKLVVMEV